jgi:hypothetical protein
LSARASEGAALHRAQHLDVANGIEAEAPGDAIADDLDHLCRPFLRLLCVDEEEVRFLARLRPFGHLAPVDAMGVDDDAALRRLPEHLGQPRHGNGAGVDDVGEHMSRADRGKLIDVADEEQAGFRRDRLEHRMHERRVDHAGHVTAAAREARPDFSH